MADQNRRIEKSELPLKDDIEVADLVEKFESRTLPYKHWTHRAHLAVAVTYLYQMSFDMALRRIRQMIKAYNQTIGDPDGYNETLTILFMRKIQHDIDAGTYCLYLFEEVARLASECPIQWVYQFYSKELIWSSEAKAGWVEPDLSEIVFK